MNRRKRAFGFDSLENLTYLSALHPVAAHVAKAHATASSRMPPIVREVVKFARRNGGSNVTVTPIESAPGSGTEYEVKFTTPKGRQVTFTIWVTPPQRGTGGAPQPGSAFVVIRGGP